jgi:hypothetical protein
LADVILKHAKIPWHLAPAGRTSCAYGSPATQNECGTAVAAVASKAGRIPPNGINIGSGGLCNDGSWGSVPLGCSAQTGGSWAAHYKTSGANCNPGLYSLVCSGSVPWHLAPAGQTRCDYGSPATQNECETAVAALASMDERIPPNGINIGSGGLCNDGSWGSVPLGCSAQTGGSWAAHYKTSGANCNPGSYSLVCSGAKSVLDLVEILGNIRKVRVQLEGNDHLHMREVQVFDKNGLNVALNKVATQSSTSTNPAGSASYAVNGNLEDFSHTNNDIGK